MTKKKYMRLLSLATIIAMLFQCFLCYSFAEQEQPISASNHLDSDNYTSSADDTTAISINDLTESDFQTRRLTSEEDLNTMVFANADGTKTAYYFNEPIKYVDEDGNVKDISLDIEAGSDKSGSFTSKEGRVISDFPKSLSDGVSLKGDGVSLRLVPKFNTTPRAVGFPYAELQGGKKVVYEADSKTSYEYSLTYSGFKEDIIVSEYTGQTEYVFILHTNGLRLSSDPHGDMYLYDEYGNERASIGKVIVFTADEQNNTFGEMTFDVIEENQEYVLRIHLDADYLSDERTVYPIKIDPEYSIIYSADHNNNIADVTINSADVLSGTSSTISAGKYGDDNSVSRILMKFPNLDTSNMVYVENATVYIRDLMCQHEYMTLECYLFTGEAWSESNAAWTNTSPNSYSDELLDSQEISYFVGKEFDRAHYYGFDITEALLEWKDIKYDDIEHNIIYSNEKGIIFKASDEHESDPTHNYKTFGSFNRTSNQPYLSITFSSEELQVYNFKNLMVGSMLTSEEISGAVVLGNNNYLTAQWQMTCDDEGYYTIVNCDLRILGGNASQELPYLESIGNSLYCTGTQLRVASFDEYMTTDDDKWQVEIFYENGKILCTIQSYSGYYLSATSSGTTLMSSSLDDYSKWELVPCSNQFFASSSDMEQYIEKINNSGLVTQMNCYAYAMGLYHYYEPQLSLNVITTSDGYIIPYWYWMFDRIYMGGVAGSEQHINEIKRILDDSSYHNGTCISDQGINEITCAIIDDVKLDIESLYGVSDGIQESSLSEKLYGGWKKVALVMVNTTSSELYDYHWYVQHSDGTWSHKPGVSPVITTDTFGNIILDPETADRGKYDCFIGYYKIYSDYVLKEAFPSPTNIDKAGDCLVHAENIGIIDTSKVVHGNIGYGTFSLWGGLHYENGIFDYEYIYLQISETTFMRCILTDSQIYFESEITATSLEDLRIAQMNTLFYRTSNYLLEEEGIAATNDSSIPGDIDFYEFTVSASGVYVIYTETSNSVLLDTYGVLYDGYNVICSSDDNDWGEEIDSDFLMIVYLEAGRNYRVSVRSYNLMYGGNYTLKIELQS